MDCLCIKNRYPHAVTKKKMQPLLSGKWGNIGKCSSILYIPSGHLSKKHLGSWEHAGSMWTNNTTKSQYKRATGRSTDSCITPPVNGGHLATVLKKYCDNIKLLEWSQ